MELISVGNMFYDLKYDVIGMDWLRRSAFVQSTRGKYGDYLSMIEITNLAFVS